MKNFLRYEAILDRAAVEGWTRRRTSLAIEAEATTNYEAAVDALNLLVREVEAERQTNTFLGTTQGAVDEAQEVLRRLRGET